MRLLCRCQSPKSIDARFVYTGLCCTVAYYIIYPIDKLRLHVYRDVQVEVVVAMTRICV